MSMSRCCDYFILLILASKIAGIYPAPVSSSVNKHVFLAARFTAAPTNVSMPFLVERSAPVAFKYLPGDQPGEQHIAVSVSVWCTMVLTTLSLIVFIALSLSRNIDELAGRGKPSTLTDLLSTASRSLSYPPVFCSMFIACRMQRLGTTAGHGVTPWSSVVCMLLASCGILLEFLSVMLVPVFAHVPKGQSISTISSANECDVHPQLQNLQSATAAFPGVLRWCTRLAMFAMYTGITGLVVLTFVNGLMVQSQGYLPVSLMCTLILGMSYLATNLAVWFTSETVVTRERRKAIGQDRGFLRIWAKFSTAHHAAVSAAMTMRRAPMITIVFLMDELRLIQLQGWGSSRDPWESWVYVATTVAFVLEAFYSSLIGAWGVQEKGYYGVHIYHGSWQLQSAKYFFNVVASVGTLISSYIIIRHSETTYVPTAVCSVFILCGLYFLCHFAQSVSFLLKDLFGVDSKKLQDTTIAACVSVGFCPMASILFVAARLRAVQITERNGSPQTWSQTAMFVIAFAIIIQALCCLMLPLFSERATECDADGHATYEYRPMFGAFVVTTVKYFALFSVLVGIVIVCISIFCINPETATYGSYGAHFNFLLFGLFFLLTILLAVCVSSAKVVGLAVKLAVEAASENMIGIDIQSESASFNIFDGRVYAQNITVSNLSKGTIPFQSPYAVKFKQVIIEFDLWLLVRSWGKTVVIQNLQVLGVDMIMEKHSFTEMSNLLTLAKHLDRTKLNFSDKGCPEPFMCLDPVCTSCAKGVRLQVAKMEKQMKKVTKLMDTNFVTLHNVGIKQLNAQLFQRGEIVLEVDLKDVTLEMKAQTMAPFDVIEMLILEVLKKASTSEEFRKRVFQFMGKRLTNNILGCLPCRPAADENSTSHSESERAEATSKESTERKKKRRPET